MTKPLAIYEQVMESIKKKIVTGELEIGDRLESERAMSIRYGINRMTVRNAIKHLINDGILESVRGSGTYVRRIPQIDGIVNLGERNEIQSLSMQIRQRGMRSSRILLSMSRIEPEGAVKDAFPKEKRVYEIIRMSLINDSPYAFQKAYIPYSMFPDAERFDFENGSLYDYMQDRGLRPKTMISYLRIESIPDEFAQVMHVSKNKKFLLFDYYGFDEQHQLVEYTISYHHPSYTSFKFEADIHLD